MFEDTIEDQLKEYLLGNQWSLQARRREKSKAKNAEKAKNIEQETKIKVAKKKKKQCETLYFDVYPNQIANHKMIQWTEENNIKKSEEFKTDPQQGEDQINDSISNLNAQIKTIYESSFSPGYYTDYYESLLVLKPDSKPPFVDEMWQTILQLGDNIFTKKKTEALEMAKKIRQQQLDMIKKFKSMQDVKFDNEKALQKLAEIPITIEDKIQGIKDTLDGLLGRYLAPVMNPDMPDFDLDVLLAKIQGFIDPLLACITPLEAVGGKVPILGDLIAIMGMMSASSGGGKLTKEEIKKLLPQKPEIPGKILDQAKGILEDIVVMAQQLPLILINIIFQMIGVIIGLFQQIAGVIGVPGIPYPLSLLPDCISAMPKIIDVVQKVPVMMYAAVKGLIKDKLAEAMALSIPKPNIDLDTLKSLIPEIEDPVPDKPSSQSKPETKKKDYTDVVKEKYEELNAIDGRYSRTDVQRILKSYKEIYDNSNTKLNCYNGFTKNEKSGDLTPNKSSITRYKGTPEDFEAKVAAAIGSMDIRDDSIQYEKLKTTSAVVGGAMYEMYKDLIKEKEPNEEVVIMEKIKPKTFMI